MQATDTHVKVNGLSLPEHLQDETIQQAEEVRKATIRERTTHQPLYTARPLRRPAASPRLSSAVFIEQTARLRTFLQAHPEGATYPQMESALGKTMNEKQISRALRMIGAVKERREYQGKVIAYLPGIPKLHISPVKLEPILMKGSLRADLVELALSLRRFHRRCSRELAGFVDRLTKLDAEEKKSAQVK